MGFLKCKSCGGYYKLQYGESINDFSKCKCGGSLKYVKSLKAATINELGQFNKTKICSKRGKENVKTSQICVFCGQMLNKSKNRLLGIAAIFTGIMVVLIPLILFSTGLEMIIIGSFVASVLISKNEKEGILNGIIIGMTSGSVYDGLFGFTGLIFNNTGSVYVIIIVSIVIGLLGGLSGAVFRSVIINKNPSHSINFNAVIMGFIVCTVPLLYFQSRTGLLATVMGGIMAAYLAGGEYKDGIRNGFITGSFSVLIIGVVLFLFNNLNYIKVITDNILPMAVKLLIGGLMGSFGGLIGIHIKKLRKKSNL